MTHTQAPLKFGPFEGPPFDGDASPDGLVPVAPAEGAAPSIDAFLVGSRTRMPEVWWERRVWYQIGRLEPRLLLERPDLAAIVVADLRRKDRVLVEWLLRVSGTLVRDFVKDHP